VARASGKVVAEGVNPIHHMLEGVCQGVAVCSRDAATLTMLHVEPIGGAALAGHAATHSTVGRRRTGGGGQSIGEER